MQDFNVPQEIERFTHSDGAFFGLGNEGHDVPVPTVFEAEPSEVPVSGVEAFGHPMAAAVAERAGVLIVGEIRSWGDVRPEQ